MSGKSKQTKQIKQQELNKDFFEAVNSNDEADVIVLLNLGAEINYQDFRGNSATMLTCGNNNKNNKNKKMLELLLSHNANVNLQNKKGITALMTAAINDCHKLIPDLIKANADVNLRNNNGDSALMIAAKEGNYYAFKALIEAGAEKDIKNNDGDSVFEIAEKKRKKTIHNYLKKNYDKKKIIQTGGAPPSENAQKVFDYLRGKKFTEEKNQEIIKLIQTNQGITEETEYDMIMLCTAIYNSVPPNIIIAIIKDYPEAAKKKCLTEKLPLQLAILFKLNIDVINALIDAYPGAVNMKDGNEKTTLQFAQDRRDDKIIGAIIDTQTKLLSSGSEAVPVGAGGGGGGAPAPLAVDSQENIEKFVENLNDIRTSLKMLNDGIISDINIMDSSWGDGTALIYQAFYGTVESMKSLLDYKPPALPNIQNRDGNTALHWAVWSRDNPAKVRLLLDYGADKSIKNNNGKTALDWARDRNHREYIEMLENYVPKSVAPSSSSSSIGGGDGGGGGGPGSDGGRGGDGGGGAEATRTGEAGATAAAAGPKPIVQVSSSSSSSSSSTSSSVPATKKYLVDDQTLTQNKNVGTITLDNGFKYYGPMNPKVIDAIGNYKLLKVSKQYGKILNQGGKNAKVNWEDVLYDNSAATTGATTGAAIRLPKDVWQWTDNYIIKQQYVTNDNNIIDTDDNCIVIFTNGNIYEGPVLKTISVDKFSVPHYEITLLHVSSKFGQIKKVNGDVIVKPTDVPLLTETVVRTETSAKPASSPSITWENILYDGTKKLTGLWEWTDYFQNYFSIPGLVMPDPNTKFSELMEQKLIRRVDMDNIVFNNNNLEEIKKMLGHEISVFGQAIILTLKYIYDNDINAYTIAEGEKKTCGKDLEEGEEEEEEGEEETNPQPETPTTVSPESITVSPEQTNTPYDAAYKLYQAGQLEDCLAALDNILLEQIDNNLSDKITLLKELCKIEQKQNTKLTQEDGTKLYTTITNILRILRDNETLKLKLICNLYYYLYIETLNNLLKDEIDSSEYTDDSVMNEIRTLLLNTLANIFEKIGNQVKLQIKYRTEYINRLTAQDKDSYTKEVNDTAAAASAAEKAGKWELAHILHERAHRYAVVYFGLDDTTFTPVIGDKKTEFLKRKGKATNELTLTIKSLYKQLSMGKPGSGEPQAAFTTFLNSNGEFNPATIKEHSKTAIKSILASVTKDEPSVDFFRNMNKDIKVEDMNIYDLLLILIKNIILCLNVYLIVSSKIYRQQPSSSNHSSPSIIVTYFQNLNLYYGFKQSYNKIMAALNEPRNRSVNIELSPEDIVKNNSTFTNMLLVTLGATLGLSGLTIATSGGGSSGSSSSSSGSSSSSSSKKNKSTRKIQYKKDERDKKNKNSKVSRKLRRK